MSRIIHIRTLLFAIAALFGGLALWEARYSYLPVPSQNPLREVAYAVRVNRFSGHVEIFVAGNGASAWLELTRSGQLADSTKR